MNQLKIKKVSPGAMLPARATAGSAGYDLYACLDAPLVVAAGQTVPVGTGIALGIGDSSVAAFIYARSGLASKNGIIPANCVGVVDSDYRGEVIVVLKNLSDTDFAVSHGDRIAQMVLTPVLLPQIQEVETLDETVRGAGGFGSTGIGDGDGI